MNRRIGLAFAVAAAMLVVVASAQAVRVKIDGHLYGMMPAGGGALATTPAARGASVGGLSAAAEPSVTAPAGWNIQYQGGPVLHTVRPYVIYWDPSGTGITLQSKNVINQYLTDVATDSGEANSTYAVGRQYYDSQGIADAGQTFSAASQALTDRDAYPASGCPVPPGYSNCITDAQLQQELSAVISHGLPTDGPATETAFPAQAPAYLLIMPQAVDTCIDATGNACSDNQDPGYDYCAYHDAYVDSTSNVVLYANVPFSIFTASPTKGCQADSNSVFQAPNGDHADGIVDDVSHELNEIITDPALDAWVNSNGGDGNELADQCQSYAASSDPTQGQSAAAYVPLGGDAGAQPPNGYGTLYDQLINGDRYYTQSLWSNGQVNCEMAPVPAPLSPSFTANLAVAGQATTINLSGTVASAGIASTTWDWGDGTTSFVPGGATTVQHTFAASGVDTVKLTAVDGNGNLATVSGQVRVGTPPTPAIGSLPSTAVVGVPVSLDGRASSDTNPGASVNYGWTFGDGGSASGAAVLHSFIAPSTYTVTLTLADSFGFSALKTATINVVAAGITKLTHTVRRGSAYLLVAVNAPGKLLSGRHTVVLRAAGAAKLKLALSAGQKRQLKLHHRFALSVRVVYAPSVGPRVVKRIRITL